MTDRELLELAAKAAGKTKARYVEIWGAMADPAKDGDGFDSRTHWNPLADNGDALWLAVKLGIEIFPDLQENEVRTAFMVGIYGYNTAEQIGTDRIAAIRRAIVRAAAEIGRRMK